MVSNLRIQDLLNHQVANDTRRTATGGYTCEVCRNNISMSEVRRVLTFTTPGFDWHICKTCDCFFDEQITDLVNRK